MASNPLAELAAAGLTSPELVQQALAAQRANELNALRGIAALRNLGFTDQQIFAMPSQQVQSFGLPGADPMRLAGGYGLLGPMTQMAGITSSHRLGRGNLARMMLDMDFQQALARAQLASRPFNTVQAFNLAKETGQAMPIAASGALPSLKPAEIGESKKYRDIIDDIIDTEAAGPEMMAGGGKLHTRGPLLMMEPRGDGTYALRAVAGEAGREKVEVTPMAKGGTIFTGGMGQTAAAKRRRQEALEEGAITQADLDRTQRVSDSLQGDMTPEERAYRASGIDDRMEYLSKIAGRPKRVTYGQAYYKNTGESQENFDRRMDRMDEQQTINEERARGVYRLKGGGTFDHGGLRSLGKGGGNPLRALGRLGADALRQALAGAGQQGGQQTPQGDLAPTSAQSDAARLIAGKIGSLTTIPTEFLDLLEGGQIPGLGEINLTQFGDVDPDARDALLDLWLSAGLTSSPEGIYHVLRRGTPVGF